MRNLLDVSGEYVRSDITEGEEGVELVLDVQVVDTTTCEPLANVALEAWACNATVSFFFLFSCSLLPPNSFPLDTQTFL